MIIQDLSHLESLTEAQRAGALGAAATYADAWAAALGKFTKTVADTDSYAKEFSWGSISFSHGYAYGKGSEGAITGVDVGGTGDFVTGGTYSTPIGDKGSYSYGAVLAIDSKYV